MLGLTTPQNARNLTDEEVLFRSQKEPWLFTVLLERYQEAFLRKTKSILFDVRDAEEVVQDAFTKIYMNAQKFQIQEGAKFSSWAYTILINTALTRYQKCVREGKRVMLLEAEFEQQLRSPGENHVYNENEDAIVRILERLPTHFASVLRLHYLERWPHKDIAQTTGESVGTIKARIHRAKAAFKKEAKKIGVDTQL